MARKRLTALPEGLWRKLAELESYARQIDLVRGFGWTLAVAAMCVGAALVADMLIDLPLLFRVGVLALTVCITLGTVVGMIWRPWRRQRSDVELAALVEHAHPELKESLVSCIELYDADIPESDRGSPLMRELSAKQALQRVAPLDFCDAVASRGAHRMAVSGLLAWALLLLPLIAPTSYRLLFARFLTPWQNLDRVSSFWFEIDAGDRVVVRGTDVVLTAQPRGAEKNIPETVKLNWVDAQGESDSRRIDFDATRKVYSTTIPHVMQDFEYYLTGGGNRSRTYRIRVVEAPAITGIKLQIQPPAYTGQPAKVLDGPVGEIAVLEQSRLNWMLTFNKPMQAAEWHWLQDSSLPSGKPATDAAEKADSDTATEKIPLKLTTDGLSASWNAVAKRSGEFRLVVRDEHGLTNETDGSRLLTVSPDAAPVLDLSSGSETDTAQATDVIPLDVVATDDVGIGALELHYEVDATRKVVVKCEPRELGGAKVQHRFNIELSSLHVKEGEFVNYRVRATDERPVPGPNETWSDRRMIRIDSKAKAPGTQQLAVEQEQLQKFLKQLKLDVAEQRDATEDLQANAAATAKDLENEDPADAREAQKKLEQAADTQAQLQARLDQLQAAFDKHPLFSNLTQQTQQLTDQEFAQTQQALSDAEQAGPAAKAEKLQAAETQLGKATEKLGQLEQQFDKLAQLERDLLELNRLAANAEQLAQRMRDLDQRQNQPPPANETQQQRETREQLQKAEEDRLVAEQKELARQADDLLQRQPELEQAARQNLREQISQLSQKAQDLAQPQQALADQLQAAADEVAQRNEALAERQAELQKQTEKLNETLAQQPNPRVKPIDPAELEKAIAELRAGNLGAAAQEEERLAKKLDELEEALREADKQAERDNPAAQQAAAEQAQKLADQQSAAAKAAQSAAEQKAAPSEKHQAEQAEQLTKRKEELAKLEPQQSGPEKQAAEDALQQAEEKQQELAQQSQDPDAKKDEPAEKELERLLKENAEAQDAAAKSLQQLADNLKQPNEKTEKNTSPPGDDPQGEEVAATDPQTAKPATPPTNPDGNDSPATPPAKHPDKQPNEKLDKEGPQKSAKSPPTASDKGDPAQPSKEEKPSTDAAEQNPEQPTAPMNDPAAQQDPVKSNPAAEQAKQLAQEARELQKQLAEAQQGQDLKSPQAQQQKLTESLEKLNEQIDQARERLQKSEPQPGQNQDPQDPAAEQKSSASKQAQQAMQEAAKELAQGNLEKSAEAGQKAAKALQESSPMSNPEQGRPPSEQSAADKPDSESTAIDRPASPAGSLPVETASQVAQAVQQLKDALAAPPPSNSKANSDQQPTEKSDSEPSTSAQSPPTEAPAETPSNPGTPPEQGPMPGESSEKKSSPPGSPSPGKPGQQPGNTPASSGEPKPSESQKGSPSRQSKSSATQSDSKSSEQGGQPSGEKSSAAPSSSARGSKSASPQSAMQSAAQRLQQAAESLRQASSQSQKPGEGPGNPGSEAASGQAQADSKPNGQAAQGTAKGGASSPGTQAGKGGEPGPEATVDVDANLARLKKRLAGRKWGELPGTLQTEILQASQKKPNSEYGELIRQYFKEIAKTQPVPK